ncbi:helix-turn-helix domain-containing protein [Sphingomonas yunnanensis]|uniref:transcriptional regulator n=1 Tax=Sphingomonas yunnanensis TaxID=310400 RepID=UPI001CA658FE|nr:YdaS family helix-turn-helix protein [Sphingomonas yunnanensis]MBY9062455.1 helix-turn-helix domain-containing protein [Sphingomonas yunnanensis]
MALEHDSDTGLARAIRAAGSQSEFARLIRRRQSTVSAWLKGDKEIPAEYVREVSLATGLTWHDLRPDLFPHDYAPSPAAASIDREVVR